LSKNLVKVNSLVVQKDAEKRIIDSNELIRRRLADFSREQGQEEEKASGEEGFVSGLGSAEVLDLAAEGAGNVIKAREDAGEMIAKAQEEAQSIQMQAQEEAQRILENARAEAEAVRNQILEQARQQGYGEGMEQAQLKVADIEKEYLEKAKELEEIYQQQIDVLEPQFVDTITSIYEHFFHVDFTPCREVLTYLISTAIHKLEGSRSFTIHVSKEDYSYVTMQKNQMLAGAVAGSSSVDVVEDLKLNKNECMIETDGGIFDCGLDTQLEELAKKLRMLSWSPSNSDTP